MSAILPSLECPEDPVIPLVEELCPAPDPWETARRLAHWPHLLFLDSADAHSPFSQYSFVTADPFDRLLARASVDPFPRLASALARFRVQRHPELPPFAGGIAGLFGYDLCHHIERLPRPRWNEFAGPEMVVGFYDWVIAFDHRQKRCWLMSTGFPERDPRVRLTRAAARMRTVRTELGQEPRPPRPLTGSKLSLQELSPQAALPLIPGLTSNFDRPSYLKAIRKAIDYVHAGDCFQVNIAQRLLYPESVSPLELFGRLRVRNPAPFCGYFDAEESAIISASPERFLRVSDRYVETRPIKGTRPRGNTPEEDRALAEELSHSAKDRAENVMIVDLLRNDLGRVCRYGTIQVPSVCVLESYRTVHHLVSEVRGRLRPECNVVDLLRAAFPGGSVTGAPKVRAMEIIAELEPNARGAYCGSLGYLGFDGTADTSILIRTLTAARGWWTFPVGGGIVADSDPRREYEETFHKANGLVRALRP